MLTESDTIAKAILDLVPTQDIRNLVIGTTKSNLRYIYTTLFEISLNFHNRYRLILLFAFRKLRSRKGTGIANQILRNATPETSCDIKIICQGKQVLIDQIFGSPSSRSSNANSLSTQEDQDQE